jgi:N-acetyl-anhydromuramyl-L-alanine amidase AmpD
MILVPKPSPNVSDRPDGVEINTIIIHADTAARIKSSIEWLQSTRSKASYHVIFGRYGDGYQLVPYHKKAWHAGKSVFMGEEDVNRFSIGIAFGNLNDGKEPYTEAQYRAGAELVKELMGQYPITLDRVTTHAIISPGRKTDPGPRFDMAYFKSLITK